MLEVYNCLKWLGRGYYRRGMLQVPTQGITLWQRDGHTLHNDNTTTISPYISHNPALFILQTTMILIQQIATVIKQG